MLNIVLYEPEIPYNTGNIGRTCVASGAGLHLIKPLGFQLTDKYIRRAGLDYWPRLHPAVHDDYTAFCRAAAGHRVWLATTKAHQIYTDVSFGPDDFIMFGPESRGIPEEILTAHEEDCIRIPMMAGERSITWYGKRMISSDTALAPVPEPPSSRCTLSFPQSACQGALCPSLRAPLPAHRHCPRRLSFRQMTMR